MSGDDSARWFDNEHPSLRRCWHPIGWLAELPGPGPHPVRLLGEDWVVAKPSGDWTLLPDRCPHRLAPLSAGELIGDELQCAYHGWRFDGAGRCVAIPAIGDSPIPPSAHLTPATRVVEHLGLLWAAIDEPITPLPELPEADDPAFGRIDLPSQTWRASAAQMADNFLDVGHFPFTHTGTIGDPDDQLVGDYSLERDGWRFHSVHHHSAQAMGPDADLAEQPVHRTMTFECTAPHHIRLELDYDAGPTIVLTFFHQPLDVDTTRLYTIELSTDLATDPDSADDAVAFQLAVAAEDQALLERLAVKAVPLGPGVETSTRADRITVELRRVLRDLVAAAD